MDNILIISVIAVYFCMLMCIGFRGMQKTKTFSDYILGGRKLTPIVGAMNVGASDMSSWLLMGLPGAFYMTGMINIWMAIGLITGSYLSWKIIAFRLRKYTEIANDSLTISSYLENRFEDDTKILRVFTAVIILFFFTIYISSGLVAGGKLFVELFGIEYRLALIITVASVVSYALIGGFLAISWADLFQGFLMLLALLVVPFMIFSVGMDFDLNNVKANLPENFLNPFSSASIAGIISILAWGLGYFGQPHIISKYMAIKDPNKIHVARKICIGWMFLALVGAMFVGILGRSFMPNLSEPETIFAASSYKIFHPILVGVLVSALLSAIMSTINGQVILCASALSEDFYRRFLNPKADNKQMLIFARSCVVLTTLVAFLISLKESSSVLELVGYAWSGLGAAIGPVIIFSLFYKNMTKLSAIFGCVIGAISSIIFALKDVQAFLGIEYQILPAFLASCLVIFIVSKIDKNKPKRAIADFKKLAN